MILSDFTQYFTWVAACLVIWGYLYLVSNWERIIEKIYRSLSPVLARFKQRRNRKRVKAKQGKGRIYYHPRGP